MYYGVDKTFQVNHLENIKKKAGTELGHAQVSYTLALKA